MKMMSTWLGLAIISFALLTGCVATPDEQVNAIEMRNDDFGQPPRDYEQTIRNNFANITPVHHPEHLEFKIRRPVQFYQMHGTKVDWFDWVVEIAYPEKAIFKFFSEDSTTWMPAYVRFNGDEITDIIKRDNYRRLKQIFAFELDSKGQAHPVENRGAVVSKDASEFFSFRDDAPPLIDNQRKAQTASTEQSPASSDVSSELRELHQLYKEGILSEGEFTAKKKQLLGL